jgi:type I restriction enzyme S subunit
MSLVGKQGYKETDIGWIPQDWVPTTLANCATITMGQSPTGDTYNTDGIGKPLLNGPTEFTNRYPVKIQWTTSPTKLCKSGDILICVRGSSTGRMNIANDEYCIGRGLASIRYKAGFSQDYLIHLLNHSVSKILKSAVGSTFPSIDGKAISSISVPTPPLPEQERIAAILTSVDDKLDVIARQIDATQTLKQGLMLTLFSRDVGTQDANDWPIVSLHEVAEVRTGVAKGKKGLKEPVELPYLRVANVQDGHIDLTEVKTIEVETTQVERYALQPGDVLMTEGGDFDKLGRGDVWEGQISPCLHQNHVFAVRPAPDKLNSYYLAALAASDYGRRYFLSCAKRTTNLASINSSQLKAFPVLLPSLAVQEEIAKVVDAVNAKITVLEEKQTVHQTLKRGLMQKLLTGEWRVTLGMHQETAIAA